MTLGNMRRDHEAQRQVRVLTHRSDSSENPGATSSIIDIGGI
jgi:hypothetical protein